MPVERPDLVHRKLQPRNINEVAMPIRNGCTKSMHLYEFTKQVERERNYFPEYVCCDKRCCDKQNFVPIYI